MSVQAELIRLGLRCFLKPTGHAVISRQRKKIGRFAGWVPPAPRDTEYRRTKLGGVPALRIATMRSRPDRHILFLHGGGYVAGSPELYRHVLWRFAAAAAAPVSAVRYRLAPEEPFPAALDDALAAWRGLLAGGVEPGRAAFLGDSAGGGLALSLALRLRDIAEPLPGAIVALSPWTDLAATGDSLRRNARADPMLNPVQVALWAGRYLGGADPRDPYASPLYGDPTGMPPTLIQVGSDEILRDDAIRMADRMRAASCAVELEIWRRMPHVWQAFAPFLPEARSAIVRIGDFIRRNIC